MEYIDEQYAARLIQEHEPDPGYRAKQLMSFEGFVRFLSGGGIKLGNLLINPL